MLYLFGAVYQRLESVGANEICILYTYGSCAGDYKFRLKRYYIAFSKYVSAVRRYYRQLIYFYTYAMAYEAGFLAMPHEILVKA